MKRSTTGFPVLHYLPGVCSNSCPLSQWCHLTNSSSAALFSFFPQSFPASGSFSMNQLFASDGQSIGASASLSVLPVNIQGWFPLGLISFRIDLLTVQGTLKSLLQNHNSKASILWHSVIFMVQFSHPYKTTGKTIALITQTFVGKVMSLLFNTLSRFVVAFLPRSKCLFISWLQSASTVILEPKKMKSVTVSILPHLFAMKWWDWMSWS